MYDTNNIVSSTFGIEMTLVFSKLSHKKEIQPAEKKPSPLQQLCWKPQPFRESIFAFFQATLLQLSRNTAQVQFLSQLCALSIFFDKFL